MQLEVVIIEVAIYGSSTKAENESTVSAQDKIFTIHERDRRHGHEDFIMAKLF